MNDDLLIRQALLDAALADYNTADLPEAPSFSTKYLAWERKFLRNPQAFAQRVLRPLWQTALRSAACFLLVVSLSFGSLMAFSPQARAWVSEWFAQHFPTYTSYGFTAQIPTEKLQHWEPTYLPEEYTDTEFIDLDNQIVVYYHSDNPSMKIKFNYKLTSEGSGFSLDNEHHTISDITVGNMPGQLFQAENDSPNMLVWFDSSSHHAFMLASRLPCDTLVQIAESVEMKK
ncbi:MAG: DUF4367 domain-containing protein [Lachnospiraceae bacterium]|nr:DUF4367 domain-containing protein [Lachnospiraceae bacterium]